MKLSIAGVKNHQTDKNHHVGEPIERGIQETAKSRNPARKPGHLPVQHVKKIGNDQDDAGPEKLAIAEQQTRADVYRDTDDRQNVWIDVAVGQPTDHRIDDPLRATADATYKHS